MNQAKLRTVLAASALLASQALVAQTAQTPVQTTDSATKQSQEEMIELSPFLVEATQDEGYQAVNTLAGTRVRTDLRDVASSISVVTSKFLQDTGARNAQDLLVYTTNTEIGGIGGNFGGLGNSNGLKENAALLHPNQNTRVRGLDAADNTRDYFLTDIPWDSYNVDRIDLQRGPNSILFGVGSPAGIVNSQTIIADLRKNSAKVENRFDQFGSFRTSLDGNIVLLKDVLALRVAALDDDTKYRQKPAFDHDKRLFGALRFDPKLFGESAHTSIRLNFETGTINANRPRDLAPMDQITPYFAKSSLNPKDSTEPTPYKISIDPWVYQGTIITGANSTNSTLGLVGKPEIWDPWLTAAMARLGSADPVFWYNSNSSSPFRIQQSNIDNQWGLAPDGTIDKTIDGLPFAHQVAIQGYNTYTKNAEQRAAALGLPDPYPGAQKNYYKDKSLTDPSIFDFYNKLIDGPNKMEREGWHAFNLNVSQTFFDNRLGFEVVWDKQMYHARQETNLSDTPFISVDINQNMTVLPDIAAYSGLPNGFGGTGAVPNPDYGRAYVGSSGHYGNHSEQSTRNDYRITTFGELRASDYLGKGWLADLLGRHDLNVLISRDERKQDDRDYLRYATDVNWATNSNETTSITQGFRNVDWITYLSGDLSGAASAQNAHIGNITA
ncbi:MAG TPA: TonB-dependent receptor plug domain-containing protein, partial [Opitutaceae bacterium]